MKAVLSRKLETSTSRNRRQGTYTHGLEYPVHVSPLRAQFDIKLIKISLFHPLDIWIFKVDANYHEIIAEMLVNGMFLRRADFCGTCYSDVSILPMHKRKGNLFLKKIKPQIAADHIRRYLGLSQALREFRSSRLLTEINVPCPMPILAATNISPLGVYESLFLCRFISGYVNCSDFLANHHNQATRRILLYSVAKDLALIHSNGLFHKDSHFGNILCNPQKTSQIYWVDNDVKKMGNRFKVYEKIALRHFQQCEYISQSEWEFFVNCYRKNLT